VVELECLPYGVGHADEGVAILLRMGSHRILLDCGLADLDTLLAQVDAPADLVLCSHAHADHARGLLPLHRAHPSLPIYASELTTELLPLNWLNETVPRFCQALPWRTPLEIQPGLTVELIPAGHLPGAAAFLLTYQGDRPYRALYTGDFLLSNSRLVDGFPLDELRGLKPDVLLLEGSYGTARFPHRRQQENQLAERIHRAISDGQSVLLPTPTLGLGQELLLLLRSHHHFTGRDLDIWVDGSVALGCDIYLEMLDHFPDAVRNFARHQALFWDERIRPRLRRFEASIEIAAPAVVLTSQDADLSRYLLPDSQPNSKLDLFWLLLLPQQPGRLGEVERTVMQHLGSAPLQQMLQSGKLTLENYHLGDHCDGAGTTQMIHNLRPQHVVLTHGSPTYLSDLTSLEELQNRYHLHSPAAGMRVALPVGEMFLQPAAPDARSDSRYEAEVAELETAVVISLPNSIRENPRWQEFADTGLVEARWQGEELVLRSLSQRELLSQAAEEPEASELACCQNCIHCRGQRCRNPESPLFSLKVTLDGCCPMFEAVPE
jgi:Cft2 family RNA processing exonuclease